MCVGRLEANHLVVGYFVTFVDDHTCYVWVYILKRRDEVYQCFCEWKIQVEKASERKIKVLCTDNGGEYTSAEFTSYLTSEGIRHEMAIPHTPQQNGVSERFNRTLIECVHTLLALTMRKPLALWFALSQFDQLLLWVHSTIFSCIIWMYLQLFCTESSQRRCT